MATICLWHLLRYTMPYICTLSFSSNKRRGAYTADDSYNMERRQKSSQDRWVPISPAMKKPPSLNSPEYKVLFQLLWGATPGSVCRPGHRRKSFGKEPGFPFLLFRGWNLVLGWNRNAWSLVVVMPWSFCLEVSVVAPNCAMLGLMARR